MAIESRWPGLLASLILMAMAGLKLSRLPWSAQAWPSVAVLVGLGVALAFSRPRADPRLGLAAAALVLGVHALLSVAFAETLGARASFRSASLVVLPAWLLGVGFAASFILCVGLAKSGRRGLVAAGGGVLMVLVGFNGALTLLDLDHALVVGVVAVLACLLAEVEGGLHFGDVGPPALRWSLFAFGTVVLLAAILSENRHLSASVLELLWTWLLVFAFVAVACRDAERRRYLFAGLVISGAAGAMLGLARHGLIASTQGVDVATRARLWVGTMHPNGSGIILAALAVLTLGLAIDLGPRWRRRALIALVPMGFGLLLCTSRSAILGLVVGLLSLAALRLRHLSRAPLPVRRAVPVLVVLALVLSALVLTALWVRHSPGSWTSRVELWRMATAAIAERPFLGWGPGVAMVTAFAAHDPARVELIRPLVETSTHNLPLELGQATGLLGLAAGLGLLLTALGGLLRALRELEPGLESRSLQQPHIVAKPRASPALTPGVGNSASRTNHKGSGAASAEQEEVAGDRSGIGRRGELAAVGAATVTLLLPQGLALASSDASLVGVEVWILLGLAVGLAPSPPEGRRDLRPLVLVLLILLGLRPSVGAWLVTGADPPSEARLKLAATLQPWHGGLIDRALGTLPKSQHDSWFVREEGLRANRPRVWLRRGRISWADGDLEAAVAAFEKAARLDPMALVGPSAHQALGRFRAGRGEKNKARGHLLLAAARDPDSFSFPRWTRRGEELVLSLPRPERQIGLKELVDSTEDPWTLRQLALVGAREGDLKALKLAIEKAPGVTEAERADRLGLRCEYELRFGDPTRARRLAVAALDRWPDPVYWRQKGLAEEAAGELPAAFESLQRSISGWNPSDSCGPQCWLAFADLGRVAAAAGEPAAAIIAWRRQQWLNDQPIPFATAQLEIARTRLVLGDGAAAARDARKVFKILEDERRPRLQAAASELRGEALQLLGELDDPPAGESRL